MTPKVSDFIPGTLEDTDKYIEVADGHQVKAKQKGQVQIRICNNNGKVIHHNLIQRTIRTRLIGQVIFNRCVNEFRTYLSFSQGVLHGVLRSREG